MNSYANIAIPRTVFWVLATALGLVVVWDSVSYRLVTYSLWADYWEHTAAITEWLRHPLNPGNPHVADPASSARYIPVFFLLTLAGRPLGLDAMDLMGVSAILNYLLIVIGIRLFCDSYFRNPWAPAVTFVVLFTAWGIPWIWSNLYELRSFMMTASYPSTFVFGLSLISFWLTLSFMRGKVSFFAGLFGLLLISALGFVSHALTGVFLIAASCLLALTERDAPASLRALVILFSCGGALLAVLWPFFPVWDVILASSDTVDDRTWQEFRGVGAMLERARTGVWHHMLYDPTQVLISLGPALLGAPLAIWLLFKRDWVFIPLGAAMMAVPYIANVFFQVALAHRFLLYMVFFLHLAIVWGILELFSHWRIERRNQSPTAPVAAGVGIVRVAVVLLAVAHIALLAGDYQGKHLKYTLEVVDKRAALPAGYDVPRLFSELTDSIPEDAIVIGHRRLTWPLPTFRGKTVALPENHENSLLPDQFERARAVDRFLEHDTPATEREAILTRYRVSHVLVNLRDTDAGLLGWINSIATPVATIERYRMYALNHSTR